MAKSTKFFALVGYACITVGCQVHYIETEAIEGMKPVPTESSLQTESPSSQEASPGAALAVPNQPLIGPDGRPVSGNIARPGDPPRANLSVEVVEPMRAPDGRPACGNVIGGKGGSRKIKCNEKGERIGYESKSDGDLSGSLNNLVD